MESETLPPLDKAGEQLVQYPSSLLLSSLSSATWLY